MRMMFGRVAADSVGETSSGETKSRNSHRKGNFIQMKYCVRRGKPMPEITPGPFYPRVKYARVLLLANEFLFVD